MDVTASTCLTIPATLSQVCRLCLGQAKLEKLRRPEMEEFFSTILNFLELILDHELPETVCDQCYNELIQMSLYIKKYTHAQNILSQIEEQLSNVQHDPSVQIQIFNTSQEEEMVEKDTQNLDFPELISDSEDTVLYFESRNDVQTDETYEQNGLTDFEVQEPDLNCPDINEVLCEQILEKDKISEDRKNKVHYMCHICNLIFNVEDEVTEHLKILHKVVNNNNNHVCDICGKVYKSKGHLVDHKNVHNGIRSYKCKICQKSFPYRGNYYSHLKNHRTQTQPKLEKEVGKSNFNTVTCNVCGKSFVSTHALKLHKFSHEENRIFPCKICNEVFSSKVLLLRHTKNHDAEKPHVCNYCFKSFSHRAYLRVHERAHTGVRPYICPVCDKSFTQKSNLTYHLLLHTSEKSFSCKYCSKRFALKGNLTVHMRIHTGERPYKCHVCDEGFRDTSSRKRHVLLRHGEHEVSKIKIVDSHEA